MVEEGVSGFVVETVGEAVAAVARVPSLDRANVRAAFEHGFTIERAAREYVEIYRQLIASHAPLKQFRKASAEHKREASHTKNALISGLPPTMGTRGKLSAKVRDSTRPVVEPGKVSVIPNAAGEILRNDGVKRQETSVGSSKLPDAS